MKEETKNASMLEKLVDRRQFTVASALAILSGVAITITSGCGGNGYSSPSSPTPTPTPTSSGDKVGAISDNHGHVAVITGAQLTAGGALVSTSRARPRTTTRSSSAPPRSRRSRRTAAWPRAPAPI